MLTNEEILEIVIRGYEQLRTVAVEKGMSVDSLVETIKNCLDNSGNNNGGGARVKIMEVKELTNFELENEMESVEKSTRFFPICRNNRKNVLNVKIKIR